MNFQMQFAVLIISYVASASMGQVGSSIDSTEIPLSREDLKNLEGEMDQSTSVRPEQPVGLTSRLNRLEAEFRKKIESIKAQNSKSSKGQDEKIAIIRARERNLAQLLNQTRGEMVGLKAQNRDQSKRIDRLEQKLAMLQNTPPASSAAKMKNRAANNTGQVSKALTPPSSCQELAMLDYDLDGLYLVKSKQTKKIQSVFCKFSADNKVSQDVIGELEMKTKTVHFYVQRSSTFSTPGAVITFEKARLNEGGAFNLASGIFTIPVTGIYHFDFFAIKHNAADYLFIYLQVNGANVGSAYTGYVNSGSKTHDVVSLSSSLRLAAGDKVNLFNSDYGMMFDNSNHHTHFTGWLVEEELV